MLKNFPALVLNVSLVLIVEEAYEVDLIPRQWQPYVLPSQLSYFDNKDDVAVLTLREPFYLLNPA